MPRWPGQAVPSGAACRCRAQRGLSTPPGAAGLARGAAGASPALAGWGAAGAGLGTRHLERARWPGVGHSVHQGHRDIVAWEVLLLCQPGSPPCMVLWAPVPSTGHSRRMQPQGWEQLEFTCRLSQLSFSSPKARMDCAHQGRLGTQGEGRLQPPCPTAQQTNVDRAT